MTRDKRKDSLRWLGVGAFTGSFPMTSRTLAVPIGPGSYTVSVASEGLCGTSSARPA
jgi:hypothetical protein